MLCSRWSTSLFDVDALYLPTLPTCLLLHKQVVLLSAISGLDTEGLGTELHQTVISTLTGKSNWLLALSICCNVLCWVV